MRFGRATDQVAMAIALLTCSVLPCLAAQEGALGHLGVSSSPVQFPSIARLVFGFALATGLMIGALVLMKRYGKRWLAKSSADGVVRTICHTTVAPGLRLTLISVDGQRILLAENRHQLQMTKLASTDPPSRESPQ
jgi:flagellar biogenesis protein FliO